MLENDVLKGELFEALKDGETIEHIGVKYRSGRFPYGSGENPFQHDGDFTRRVQQLKDEGLTDDEIVKALGLTSKAAYRERYRVDHNKFKMIAIDAIKSWKEDGLTGEEIATRLREELGYKIAGESGVRSLLKEERMARLKIATKTADFLKKQVDEYGLIDIGAGTEGLVEIGGEGSGIFGVSDTKFKEAVTMLKDEGYEIFKQKIPQVTNPKQLTTVMLLAKPGTTYDQAFPKDEDGNRTMSNYHTLSEFISDDNGETFRPKLQYPASFDSKRLQIKYNEEGGIEKDGLIELRRGAKDLYLGGKNYAQVRILVDGTHYLKGMAVYSDDLPEGIDIRFNTNKHVGTPALGPKNNTVLKPIKSDPKDPFGALIKEDGQSYYSDDDGNERLSPINKTREEDDWSTWKDRVPSQFLSKQSPALIKQQLEKSIKDRKEELERIESLTNPTVKKQLLMDFAQGCDETAVELSAAALPGQKYHVILPMTTLREGEIYAPRYPDGTKLALVRYPHEGVFQIPILTVNNSYEEGKKMIGSFSQDAVGISHKSAERLSGADFDGDTVMTIPITSKTKITATKEPLKGLKDFDPSVEYPEISGMKYMTKQQTQTEMGKISNLITDMTIQGATADELACAVRHSMTVIDAEKHSYNYKKSETDNHIEELKRKYQQHPDGSYGGAATLISRASAQAHITKRVGSAKINTPGKPWYDPDRPEGALVYTDVSDESKRWRNTISKETRAKLEKSGFTNQEIQDIVKVGHLPDGTKIDINKKDNRFYNTITKKQRENLEKQGYSQKEIWDITNKGELPDGTPIKVKVKERTEKSTQMAETDDAFTLVSEFNTERERLYAAYANQMKSFANNARKEYVATPSIKYSPQAAKTYAEEVASLKAKLNLSESNTPKERAANVYAYNIVQQKKKDNPDMQPKDVKKESQKALNYARGIFGAKRHPVDVTPKEWEAIQAGAISASMLDRILKGADMGKIQEYALPRSKRALSTSQVSRIKNLAANGYTLADIADYLGVSVSTVTKYAKGDGN